jgi:short-subunit dehydrogenase
VLEDYTPSEDIGLLYKGIVCIQREIHGTRLKLFDTNMMGAIRTTKAFIPYFREKGAGLFINTTSIDGLITVPFNSMYHATKNAQFFAN